MRRFFADPERCRGSRIELDEEESHHAARVIRVREGEPVTVLNGAGGIFECAVESLSKRAVTLEVKSKSQAPPLPYQLTLVQSIPKGKVMDLIVQKATELGVVAIIPIVTERTIVEIAHESAETKTRKWRSIALEAIKQCGSPWLPRIEAPRHFAAALRSVGEIPSFVASLHEGAKEIGEHLKSPTPASIWIGPEGDFTPVEVESLITAGARPFTLGPLVLRCDTAAVASLAIFGQQMRLLGTCQ
jgi:16S rRNA (uracil1498-N3)-methyltransferase